MSNVEELAAKHWEYVKGVIIASDRTIQRETRLAEIEYHYTTAFIHGYKHGCEDVEQEMRQAKQQAYDAAQAQTQAAMGSIGDWDLMRQMQEQKEYEAAEVINQLKAGGKYGGNWEAVEKEEK